MNDTPATSPAPTAGALIRAARERRGVRIENLAVTLKISPRKLEALEADRHEELPGPAFTRALALSVCRVMGVDAAPVLALMPRAEGAPDRLEHVTTGLRAPFAGRPGQGLGAGLAPFWRVPSRTALAALVLSVLVVGLLWWSWAVPTAAPGWPDGAASAPAVSGAAAVPASAPAMAASADAASAVAPGAEAASLPASASASAGVTPSSEPVANPSASTILVTAVTWVELRDGGGRLLWARTLAAGETATLDGPAPLRLVVGNASAARVVFAGRRIDLEPWTKDNVARLELQ
jgi:cytoskeleton protein RodZ